MGGYGSGGRPDAVAQDIWAAGFIEKLGVRV